MKKLLLYLTMLSILSIWSCEEPATLLPSISGCTDEFSFNYHPDANEDDGSCMPMHGCLGWVGGYSKSGQTISSLGHAAYDQKFWEEVAIQRAFFQQIPAQVSILLEPEPELKNAYASSDGQIRFGYYMFWDILDQYGELPVASILAHEWGHRTQFHSNWNDYNQPAHMELEADAFSGFYLFLAKRWAWSQIQDVYQALMDFGDYNFNHPQHHGTPNERYAAARLGVELGKYAVENERQFSYKELHDIFIEQIRTQIKPRSLEEKPVEYSEITFPEGVTDEEVRKLFPRE
jgi:hypothetical protein